MLFLSVEQVVYYDYKATHFIPGLCIIPDLRRRDENGHNECYAVAGALELSTEP